MAAEPKLLTLNTDKIVVAIRGAVMAGMNHTVLDMEVIARRKAPVRKVFNRKAGRGRRANDFFPTFRVRYPNGKVRFVTGDFRAVEQIGPNKFKLEHKLAERVLTARGRGYLKTGANTLQFVHAGDRIIRVGRNGGVFNGRLGGRLRHEITAVFATWEGSRAQGGLISPTPYAKFMELGTRYVKERPFLRPALQHEREHYRDNIIRALRGLR